MPQELLLNLHGSVLRIELKGACKIINVGAASLIWCRAIWVVLPFLGFVREFILFGIEVREGPKLQCSGRGKPGSPGSPAKDEGEQQYLHTLLRSMDAKNVNMVFGEGVSHLTLITPH